MDEIEYKLNTKNSVLIVNAVDKLLSTIKSKYKPVDRQKFALENEELKFLREKCSSKEMVVSLTACQGLLALVELGVLEIGHTMSTIITLLPTAHNYSAIITTMAGLLILDLKSRLVPGQPYKCQFSLKSPQHPFITVLERNKDAEDDVLAQMHALCTHPDYIVCSNSLELLCPVFLWLTCNPQRGGIGPWQLLLSLPQSTAQFSLLLSCLSCQQICNPQMIGTAFAAYSAVADAAIYRQDREYVTALLPMLARVSNELIRHGRDPRVCYSVMERCVALEAAEARSVAGLALLLLAHNLPLTSALYLHELFNLALSIISKYEYTKISLNTFVALSLQWLHLPSYLTTAALKVASKILDIHQSSKEDGRLHTPNLKSNKIFQTLLYTDKHLFVSFKLIETWERVRDDPEKLRCWLDNVESVDDVTKEELTPFLVGVLMENGTDWFEEFVLRALKIVVSVVEVKKEVAVMLMPVLMYKIGNDSAPKVKMEFLRALPLMAKTKENVPIIVSFLNKLKAKKGVPTCLLIALYTSLAETQVRCFPYLQELLVEGAPARDDESKWELDVARAVAVDRICEIRASSHGLELVSIISALLNRCTDRSGSAATSAALSALRRLWLAAAVAPPGAWRALRPRLDRDARPAVQPSVCKLLSEVPGLRVSTPEYDTLISEATRKLWSYIAEANEPEVVEAACDALANYKLDDYKLKDIPEVYRRTVKLPAAFCKTPADAARKPEDVLDYVPCEIWPEVFKYTNQAALAGVERLATRLIEREVKGYRSGVYQVEGRGEPQGLGYLPPHSVLRGLMECFRKQVTSPSYLMPEAVLLSIANVLGAEFPRAPPPLDVCFLHEAFHRGDAWKERSLRLAARYAAASGSARRLLQNYLVATQPPEAQESDILLIFELLPILCRTMPPNSIREPLEKCLFHSWEQASKIKATDVMEKEPLFVTQLTMIKACLDSKIHDANRTLQSQFVENYYTVIPEDNVAWKPYVSCCLSLSAAALERMSSPSSWWEVSGAQLRRAGGLRGGLAANEALAAPLNWLNELVDAHAGHVPGQEQSLESMWAALRRAKADAASTRDWFLQLMARAQVAFKETEDISSKLYLFDVFVLSAVTFSGCWALSPSAGFLDRVERYRLLPAAIAALLARESWQQCATQVVEWLSHSSGGLPAAAAACCRRALLAARHAHYSGKGNIWTKLDGHFALSMTNLED